MGREDPQLKLRLSEELKALITQEAKNNGRSVNAEIVQRIEAYDGFYHRMMRLVEERDKLQAQLEAHQDALNEQRMIAAGLQQLLAKNSEDAEREDEALAVIEKRFNELKEQSRYLEELKAELISLHKDLKDEQEKDREVLEEQRSMLSRIADSEKRNSGLLLQFGKMLKKAASGDRDELDQLLKAFSAADQKDE